MRTIVILAVSISMVGTAALRAAEPIRNLALNRAAYASSCGEYYKFNTAGFIDTGHMATDGHLETMWRSKGGAPQWIYVDLGAICTVRQVVLRWDRFHAKAYKLQVSTNAGPSPKTGFVENWTDVYKTADGRGGVDKITLTAPVQAHFVRLFCTKQGTDKGFAPRFDYFTLREFEVYGTGGPARPSGRFRRRPTTERGTFRADGNSIASRSWPTTPRGFPPAATTTAAGCRPSCRGPC